MAQGASILDLKSHMERNTADAVIWPGGIEWTRHGGTMRFVGCWTAGGRAGVSSRLGCAGRRLLMVLLIPVFGLFAVLTLSSPAAAWPTTTTTAPPTTTTTTTVPPSTTTTAPPVTTTTLPPVTTTTAPAVVTPSVTPPTVPPSTSPAVATTPQIAFTGAPVGAEAAVGVGLVGAGSALVLAARRRRARI